MRKVSFDELKATFKEILLSRGLSDKKADIAAQNFAETSADGIYSHGVNRFPRAVSNIDDGVIDINAEPECVSAFGAFERWDGNLGMGNYNAFLAMNRACELAKEHGVGIVAMKNTNHWMRGGAYGWQAADNGMLGICWTNTWPNMPAWGGLEQKLGNNPFIMAVPKQNGHHMVLDMAVSQYAYGKVEFLYMKGEQLPYPGGWDTKGNLTTDPAEIMKSKRFLPVGYWKGSGMSILMDVFANALAAGYLVNEVKSKFGGEEMGLTQFFMAINPRVMDTPEYTDSVIDRVVEDIKASTPETEGGKIFYPGEIEVITREDHMKNGIPVLDEVWDKIQALKK